MQNNQNLNALLAIADTYLSSRVVEHPLTDGERACANALDAVVKARGLLKEAAHAQQEAAPAKPDDLAALIHYPECWDTAVYPALTDALREIVVTLKCSECIAPTTVPDHSEREASNAGGRTFWVVEQFKDGRSSGYWDGGNSRQFTNDIDKAIQFCRHADALWATRGWHWGDTKITEHIILASPATIAAGQEAANAKDAASLIVRDVCELDYWGEDWDAEKMFSVTVDDLRLICERNIAAMAAVGAARQEGGNHG